MIDVNHKSNTLRYAIAEGKLFASPSTIIRVKENDVPKGNVPECARAAGILAAKKAQDWMIFCHSIPIDWVEVKSELKEDHIYFTCEVKSVWKTGVEMEALTGVSAALLNAYDMMKPIDKELSITDIKLAKKKGGKSSFSDVFDPPLKVAVLVISDSTFAGTRKDKSGLIIKEYLSNMTVDIDCYEVLPDVKDQIRDRLISLVDDENIDLIFTTGGTGFGPKDLTPEATIEAIDKEADGIAEAIRMHGLNRTPFAMLSRLICGLRGDSLIINLPGSSNGAKEGLDALFPGLLHSFKMIRGGGH